MSGAGHPRSSLQSAWRHQTHQASCGVATEPRIFDSMGISGRPSGEADPARTADRPQHEGAHRAAFADVQSQPLIAERYWRSQAEKSIWSVPSVERSAARAAVSSPRSSQAEAHFSERLCGDAVGHLDADVNPGLGRPRIGQWRFRTVVRGGPCWGRGGCRDCRPDAVLRIGRGSVH